MKRPAVFFDRDGVLNRAFIVEGKPHPPSGLDEFELIPGVLESCRQLKQAGYVLVVATNQPDVGRGTLAKKTVERMHERLLKELPLDRIEICYHSGLSGPDCECRKPKPGMLLDAARELEVDLKQSWMIGDRHKDMECGELAGCRTILIGSGYGEEIKVKPNFTAETIMEAVTIILNSDNISRS